ncbi:hypothetical protein NUJ30_08565 [Burkholderia contaminans]|uniref:hypothetical protein n=1 Tax=Burkholderia contaminans TaxID=488447 RepID=UPI00174E2AC7|nr:hypothetical protein [Burkholderia contaminans]MBD1412833.1 hypothetical protein [Burkholderia contaminans]UXZ68716.1 hypothetical protein NUJ29_08570 [Burkholderia contaminans]UXZ76477.1 hypothetical protein NUJ30_08565 [Burkholderia contaminans]
MKERPILFSGAMVRAILEGSKTQTRRIVKPTGAHHIFQFRGREEARGTDEPTGEWAWCRAERVISEHIRCPYGKPGDRLWVREAFRLTSDFDGDSPTRVGERCLDAGYRAPWAPVRYEVDGAERDWRWVGTPPGHEVTAGRARASMHMPRWASRITLEITDVRAERLQAISWDDAIAEGIKDPRRAAVRIDPIDGTVAQFRQLWDSLNAAQGHGWDANPWAWVVEFRKVES